MAKSAAKRTSGGDPRHGRELSGGYIASGLIFAAVTALWAFIVRDDPFYRLTDLFGVRVPAMLAVYLGVMPVAGFIIGRWRYDRGRGGFARFTAKLGARALHFAYAHSLIVLFTAAMLAETWLGLDLDDQVKQFDDRMFDFAARFAPWLAAYLTGFNFGRATVAGLGHGAYAATSTGETSAFIEAPPVETPTLETAPIDAAPENPLRSAPRAEPLFTDGGGARETRTPRPRQTASGLAIAAAPEPEEPGFLPPQDLDRLRPALSRLR
jgi:hypothetical protein